MTPEPEPTPGTSRGLVSYRIGGYVYPQRIRRGCRVCASEYREEIERDIAQGRTFADIATGLPDEADLGANHISNHYRADHMPLRQATLRKIAEDRQAELGRAIEGGVEVMADHVSLARAVVNQTWSAIASGDLKPTMSEGLAAAKLLQQAGIDDNGLDKSTYTEAFIVYMETLQRYLTPQEFAEYSSELSANPTLKALMNRFQNRGAESKDALSYSGGAR